MPEGRCEATDSAPWVCSRGTDRRRTRTDGVADRSTTTHADSGINCSRNGLTKTQGGSPGRAASKAIHRRSGDNREFVTDMSSLFSSSICSPVSVSMTAIEFGRPNRWITSRRSSTHSPGRPRNPRRASARSRLPERSTEDRAYRALACRRPRAVSELSPIRRNRGIPLRPGGPSVTKRSEPVRDLSKDLGLTRPHREIRERAGIGRHRHAARNTRAARHPPQRTEPRPLGIQGHGPQIPIRIWLFTNARRPAAAVGRDARQGPQSAAGVPLWLKNRRRHPLPIEMDSLSASGREHQ